MRIGIDCRTMLNPKTGEMAGVGHYTTYLVRALVKRAKKDTFVLFFDHRMPDRAIKDLASKKNVEIVRFPYSQYKRYLPFGYSHIVVAQALKRAQLDLFHAPAYIIPYQYDKPAVITIHDLAIYPHPEWFPPKQQFSRKVLVPSSIQRAKKIIAVSQATAKMVRDLFSVAQEDISVVYEGVTKEKAVSALSKIRTRKKFNINERFLLYIGTIEPRKNLENLVKAFDQFMREHYRHHKDVQLVIAGVRGWKYQQIFRTIARAKWSSSIRVIGYVTQHEKITLLQASLFFAFPTLWEGFGLPVLEAASLGVPVLTSRVSSLPEVAGSGAVYVKPESVRSIQEGITMLVRQGKKRVALGKKGKQHAKKFSWEKCAAETMKVYTEVVHSQPVQKK